MMATTSPTARGFLFNTTVIHALDKHSGLPMCGAPALVHQLVKEKPIPVDTPRSDLGQFLTCAACLRAMGAPKRED